MVGVLAPPFRYPLGFITDILRVRLQIVRVCSLTTGRLMIGRFMPTSFPGTRPSQNRDALDHQFDKQPISYTQSANCDFTPEVMGIKIFHSSI